MSVISLRSPSSPVLARKVTRWTQVLSHLDPQYGGIAASVPELARATEDAGSHSCGLLGFCGPEEIGQAGNLQIIGSPSRTRTLFDPGVRSRLRQCIEASEGIHIHGLWETHSMAAARMAHSCQRPYLISAHGMLDSWAVKQKRLKKAVYAALIELRVMQNAACLRALTSSEIDDYRRLGLMNPVVVVPNGVSVPNTVDKSLFRNRFPQLDGKKIALFLGRLHVKKGLAILLEAWDRLLQDLPPAQADTIHLVLAGPDSDGTQLKLQEMAKTLGVQDSVTFAGMLAGPEKWSALAAANVFVLPSFSEGLSVSVLEAMAMCIPVIVSEPCHIPEVAQRNCGWVIQPTVTCVHGALREFFVMSNPEVSEMGDRGRRLIEERFSWPVVGQQMSEVYSWLDGGPSPRSVEVIQ